MPIENMFKKSGKDKKFDEEAFDGKIHLNSLEVNH